MAPILASAQLIGHGAAALTKTPEGELLLSAGTDGTLRAVDMATLTELLRLDATGSSLASITDDGRRVVTRGENGTLRLWGCP